MIIFSRNQKQHEMKGVSMNAVINREIRLKRRPVGIPDEGHFELVETRLPEPREGEVLVRNIYLSVDPYMRGRMNAVKSYVPPFELGKPLEGHCVGSVIASRSDRFNPGDLVQSMFGWREYYLSNGTGLSGIEPGTVPLQAYLGVLGMTGFTAYVGLLDIGRPREGDTLFVSAASGAVGSIVCQIGKIKGCRVSGSAGSARKIDWLKQEAGIDAALNYKETDDLSADVGKLCPDGIDIYYENVGGRHLEAALTHMNSIGRIVLCGMISQYNAVKPVPGPGNLFLAISKRLRLQGFIITDHLDRHGQFITDMQRWISEGKIRWKETIVDGIENAPKAFVGLFKGENFGKMLIRVGS